MLTPPRRREFDAILDAIIGALPGELHDLIEEVPVIVEDEPDDDLLEEMQIDPMTTDLCGLHSGIPLTLRSNQHSGTMPEEIRLFRAPIIRQAGRKRSSLEKQIRITLLHEIGHHFGLDEDDLEKLGYR